MTSALRNSKDELLRESRRLRMEARSSAWDYCFELSRNGSRLYKPGRLPAKVRHAGEAAQYFTLCTDADLTQDIQRR
jgi:hypothetical protein